MDRCMFEDYALELFCQEFMRSIFPFHAFYIMIREKDTDMDTNKKI
jgi:hypothetical protein